MPTEPTRELPVHPDLRQLKNQAKDLLKDWRAGNAKTLAEVQLHLPSPPTEPKLTDAQLVLARAYGVRSWPRLVTACHVVDAIWNGDLAKLRELVVQNPKLLQESALGRPQSNWGPPLSYAATAGQTAVVAMLTSLGAADIQYAFNRACLKGNLTIARRLLHSGATLSPGLVMGPCETLNGTGLRFLLELGASVEDEHGDTIAPVGLVLQTYTRHAAGKHECLELLADRGVELPDTPPMALHRGRLDLLQRHLDMDPQLFRRTFRHEEMFPANLGCHEDHTYALHGTPLAGGTLLHMAVDYDEFDILAWMLEEGADPNAKADVDGAGFGGHTPLFGCVVSQPYRANVRGHERFAGLLLQHGAKTDIRANLRKALRFVRDESEHQYFSVTPREWGEQFHDQDWVNPAVMRMLA
ncbi:MAG: ankyrin repeat domain-containing protein [Armatimonadetes bacterium]|nr:ankyrin repeat domain-containing protein [Armatimonadota bacterium]